MSKSLSMEIVLATLCVPASKIILPLLAFETAVEMSLTALSSLEPSFELSPLTGST